MSLLRSPWRGLAERFERGKGIFLAWPAKRRVRLLFGLLLLLFNAFSAATYLGFRGYAGSSGRLAQGRAMQARLDLAAAQTKKLRQLGLAYLNSGATRSPLPYREGLLELSQSLAALKPMAESSGELAHCLSQLSMLAEGRHRLLLASASGASGARSRARAEADFSAMDALFQQASEQLQKLIGGWEWESRSDYRIFILTLLLGNLLAFALIGWALQSLIYHIARGDQSSKALDHMQAFLDSTAEAAYGIDREGNCTLCNRACLRLLGYEDASQLLGKNMHALVFVGPHERDDGCHMTAAIHQGKNLHVPECVAYRGDGSQIQIECWSSLIYDQDRIAGAAVTLSDISAAKAAEGASRSHSEALELQLRDLARHSKEMALFGQMTEMLQACASQAELCKVVAVFAKGLFPDAAGALYLCAPDASRLLRQEDWGAAEAGPAELRAQDCWAMRKGKPHYRESLTEELFCLHVPLPLPDFSYCLPLSGQGGTLGLLLLRAGAAGQRLSEPQQLVAVALAFQVALGFSNLKLKEILREEAIRDPATGLFNRRFMSESLEHEIQRAQRNGTQVGVIAFDLDHFKALNDGLGHASGDAMLLAVAGLAKASLRAEDISCRQGGDEFFLILPDIAEADLLVLAERLRQDAAQLSQKLFHGLAPQVTLSAGLALFPADAMTADAVQKAADQALYRAKLLGRNRVFAASHLHIQGVPA